MLSYDVGVEKPDRRIFDAAVASLKETLSGRDDQMQEETFEKLYVGDSRVHDFSGAKGAGWNALLLDRDGTFEKTFQKEGEDLVTVSVKEDGSDNGNIPLRVIKDLGVLSNWRPSNSIQ